MPSNAQAKLRGFRVLGPGVERFGFWGSSRALGFQGLGFDIDGSKQRKGFREGSWL